MSERVLLRAQTAAIPDADIAQPVASGPSSFHPEFLLAGMESAASLPWKLSSSVERSAGMGVCGADHAEDIGVLAQLSFQF